MEAKPLRDAVGVRVVAEDFGDVESVAVAEASFAQCVDVSDGDSDVGLGELGGPGQHDSGLGRNPARRPWPIRRGLDVGPCCGD